MSSSDPRPKTVLVQYGEFNGIVQFQVDSSSVEREALIEEVKVAFKERVRQEDRITLQIAREEWDGVFVDFFSESVPDKSKLKLIVEKNPEATVLDECFRDSSTPKRPKYSEEMQESRMDGIDEEFKDIDRILEFKEKRLVQAEAAKKYTLCEQLTMEMRELREKIRELKAGRKLLINKGRRARKRQINDVDRGEDESSDIDADCWSSSSWSVTPCPLPHISSPNLSDPSVQTQLDTLESPQGDL